MSKSFTFDLVVKKFLFLLAFLIISPIVLSIGFKAIKIYTVAPKIYFAYIILIIGILLILYTVFLGFKAINTFLNYLFQK